MATFLEQFNVLVLYFVTFSFYELCMISDKIETGRTSLLLLHSGYRALPSTQNPYSELCCFAFSRIRTEYGEILLISPYSVRMQENADQNKSEYGHFLRSVFINSTR